MELELAVMMDAIPPNRGSIPPYAEFDDLLGKVIKV